MIRSEISGQVVAEVASWTSQPTRDCPAAVGGRPSLDLASTYNTIADHRFGRFQAALVLLWKGTLTRAMDTTRGKATLMAALGLTAYQHSATRP